MQRLHLINELAPVSYRSVLQVHNLENYDKEQEGTHRVQTHAVLLLNLTLTLTL